MLLKVTRLSLFSLSFLFLPATVSAQAEDALPVTPDVSAETKTYIVADINVGDVQSTETDGVVTGSFSLLGNMGLQNRIAAGLVVTDSEGNLLDVETIESNLSLRMGEVKTVPFSYRWPEYLSGTVKLSVVAETTGGLPLGRQTITEKKFPAASGNPIRCSVGEKAASFTCVSQKPREAMIEYFAGSVFAAPARPGEKVSLTSTATFVPKIDLPSGRYMVKLKDTETDQALFFWIRVPGEYGKIRNVVVYRNENPRIARITTSILASPFKGVSIAVELRDASGWSCGTANAQSEAVMDELSIATTCSAGVLTVSLKNAAGQELERIEEPFNVLTTEAEAVNQAGQPGSSTSQGDRETAASFLQPGVFVAVGVILLILIGFFIYRRRQTHLGVFLFSITLGAGMFGGVPTASALTQNVNRWGGSSGEIAWDCTTTTNFDKGSYIPGETAILTSTVDMFGDVESRGAGSCTVAYYRNPTNTAAAIDSEALGTLATIANVAGVPMGGMGSSSGSTSFVMPTALSTGAHSITWIRTSMSGNCWGGCGGPSVDIDTLPFNIGPYCDLGCGGSMTWRPDGSSPANPFSCGAGTKLITGAGSWSGGSCGSGTYTRDPGGAFFCAASSACTTCRTNIVLQSNDICASTCTGNADIYRVQSPSGGAYNQAWWNDSTGISCGATCASFPTSGRTITEINALPICLTPPPPICVLGARSWAGLTVPNFWFGGGNQTKDSLCPAGQAMIGSRSYQYTYEVDEEYEEAYCAAGVSGLGASHRVEAPNAWAYENPGNKIALCPAGEVGVGVRMFGIFSSVDEEHIDIYCAPLPSATLDTAASHWVSAPNAGSTLFGGFKTQTCPGGEVVTGVRWFQWPSNLDEEHTDIQCTPISLACGATASVVVTPGAIVGVETPSLWQRVWNYILGRESIAHAAGSANILVNQEGVVTWSSSGVSDCTITSAPALTGFPISLTTGGSYTIPSGTTTPGQSYTFTMNCTGATGGAADSATLNVAAATDFKVCPTTTTIGTGVSTQLRAYYETVGAVDCGNTAASIEVTTDPSTNWSSANAGIASVNNGGSKGLVTGVSAGTANITATYLTNSNSSAVTVSCAPSNSCASAPSVDMAANTCTGQTFNINDGCGATITCNGTRTCDFNWKEVGQ